MYTLYTIYTMYTLYTMYTMYTMCLSSVPASVRGPGGRRGAGRCGSGSFPAGQWHYFGSTGQECLISQAAAPPSPAPSAGSHPASTEHLHRHGAEPPSGQHMETEAYGVAPFPAFLESPWSGPCVKNSVRRRVRSRTYFSLWSTITRLKRIMMNLWMEENICVHC